MILLDTNVLSALMLREPDTIVVAWLDQQPAESIWTTSVTVFEIMFGLELLAQGRKRRQLELAFSRALAEDLSGRVVPFDDRDARAAGSIAARERAAGRWPEVRDMQIAGIASARKATLATRNTRHFANTGIRLIDPWET